MQTLESAKVEKAAEELWGNELILQEERIAAMRKLAQSNAVKAFELLQRQ